LIPAQLDAPPYDYAYSLGEDIGTILPPPPSGFFYTNLLPADVIAMTWEANSGGLFTIKADVSQLLELGEGVYTVVVWVKASEEFIAISNYSIFIN
jgi:hypothetical protein